MFERLSPWDLIRGQWYSLSFHRDHPVRADWIARLAVFGAPIGVGIWVAVSGSLLKSPSPILSGVSLLAGGLLAAFAQLSTLRLRLTEHDNSEDDPDQIDRDYIDETANHVLLAAYVSALTAVSLVIGLNTSVNEEGSICGPLAAISAGLGSYVAIVFLMAIPRLFSAYLQLNKVRVGRRPVRSR